MIYGSNGSHGRVSKWHSRVFENSELDNVKFEFSDKTVALIQKYTGDWVVVPCRRLYTQSATNVIVSSCPLRSTWELLLAAMTRPRPCVLEITEYFPPAVHHHRFPRLFAMLINKCTRSAHQACADVGAKGGGIQETLAKEMNLVIM